LALTLIEKCHHKSKPFIHDVIGDKKVFAVLNLEKQDIIYLALLQTQVWSIPQVML